MSDLKRDLRAEDRVTDNQASRNDQGDDEHLEERLLANCNLTLSDFVFQKPIYSAIEIYHI